MFNIIKHRNPKAALMIFFIAVGVIISCQNNGTPKINQTPTSGETKIMADESYIPMVDSQIRVFTSLYKLVHITPVYKAEKQLIADFLNDSVDVVVTSWTPSESLKEALLKTQVVIRTVQVAHDALALVMNRNNMDSLLTYDMVRDIFTGKITSWKQINPESKHGNINMVFDNDSSANIRYFKEKFNLSGQLPPNFFALNSNPEVINYVSKSPDALGIVSVNWISDREDSLSRKFSGMVKVAAISQEFLDRNSFYFPVQGSIYDNTYPFVRTVNMLSRESSTGPGSGFIAWVAGEQGQRIILKAGLVPATMPIRMVQTRKQ